MPSEMPLPTEFINRLNLMLPANQVEAVINSFSHPKPTTLRANTIKTTSDQLQTELNSAGLLVEKVDWLPNAFILKQGTLADLNQLPAYQEGRLYVQGLSSQIPPHILAPTNADFVLDIAAAPGSKTSQMAALMLNGGHIVANDTSRVRLYKLQANLQTLGVNNVEVSHGLGQKIGFTRPLQFTKALADVPCSMEGRFQINKPKTFSNWQVKKIKELATRQKALLRAAVRATRPGGEIVYSTCTLAPEENEGVITWLLRKEPQVKVLPISLPGCQELSPALASWQNKVFPTEVAQNTKRIWPNELMEGFYIAKLGV